MLKDNLLKIQTELPSSVRLIAVSKFQPIEKLQEAYQVGQRAFGENRPQEMRDKQPLMPKDVQWHFIGHLQTNKIKYIIPYVTLIHSISSPELLKSVNKEAEKIGREVDYLLEFHIASEESKQGFNIEEAVSFIGSDDFQRLENVKLRGVMGMASFVEDMDIVRNEFKTLKSYFNTLKQRYYSEDNNFCEISMGMSGDYKIAIEEGSTMVRIGTAIFGARNY